MTKRKTTLIEKEVFNYLNDLRESGITNMFGAAPYIIQKFELDKNNARHLLSLWMSNFDENGNYEEIEDD